MTDSHNSESDDAGSLDVVAGKAPEYLMDLAVNAEDILRNSLGLSEEMAHRGAIEIRDRMRTEWGGQLLYFGKGVAIDIAERDLSLWADFNGRNHLELSKKYDLALQTVYGRLRIIKESLGHLNQPDLFG